MVDKLELPYVLFSSDMSSYSSQKFPSGRGFKFVEMSGFLTICYFLMVSHILMILKMQKNYYYNFLKKYIMIIMIILY
jgi:hypothetical protein